MLTDLIWNKFCFVSRCSWRLRLFKINCLSRSWTSQALRNSRWNVAESHQNNICKTRRQLWICVTWTRRSSKCGSQWWRLRQIYMRKRCEFQQHLNYIRHKPTCCIWSVLLFIEIHDIAVNYLLIIYFIFYKKNNNEEHLTEICEYGMAFSNTKIYISIPGTNQPLFLFY